MADTLVREGIAYGSQPLSPVPQYWDGTSYAKAQGVNGAIRVINYNSAGETFTAAIPGVMQVALSAGGSAAFSNTIPGTVQLVTSAGATNLFSGTNPASIKLTATSTVNFSGSGTVEILSSAGGTAYFSGTKPAFMTKSVINRQLIFSGTKTFSSGATATSDLTYSITGSITATFTTPNHELFISNDGPYDITATVYKTISAAGTFNTNIGVSLLVPKITSNGTLSISAKSSQIQGLFNFNQGINIVLTATAAFTAAVTTNLLIKELDL